MRNTGPYLFCFFVTEEIFLLKSSRDGNGGSIGERKVSCLPRLPVDGHRHEAVAHILLSRCCRRFILAVDRGRHVLLYLALLYLASRVVVEFVRRHLTCTCIVPSID